MNFNFLNETLYAVVNSTESNVNESVKLL